MIKIKAVDFLVSPIIIKKDPEEKQEDWCKRRCSQLVKSGSFKNVTYSLNNGEGATELRNGGSLEALEKQNRLLLWASGKTSPADITTLYTLHSLHSHF